MRLLHALEALGRTVQAIRCLKQRLNLPAYDQEREQQILAYLLSKVDGPYAPDHVAVIFSAVFEASCRFPPARGDELSRTEDTLDP